VILSAVVGLGDLQARHARTVAEGRSCAARRAPLPAPSARVQPQPQAAGKRRVAACAAPSGAKARADQREGRMEARMGRDRASGLDAQHDSPARSRQAQGLAQITLIGSKVMRRMYS